MLEVKGHNVIVAVDRSGSMDTRDCDGQTRYSYLSEKVIAFVAGAIQTAFNNQVTLLFFNSGVKEVVASSETDAKAAFGKYGTGGSTATDRVLEAAFAKWQQGSHTPAMLFLVTDGVPDDQKAVDREIVRITQRITNPEDFRIMILTVGERDSGLDKWLEHLDSDLDGAKFDIVGLNSLQEVDFQEAAAELIASTTTNDEALAGATAGKSTHRID